LNIPYIKNKEVGSTGDTKKWELFKIQNQKNRTVLGQTIIVLLVFEAFENNYF